MPDLILFFPLFFLSAFAAFYIPGRVLLGDQKKMPPLAQMILSLVLGITAWGWQGYIFGYLGGRWLSYAYLICFILLFLKNKYFKFQIKYDQKKIDPGFLLIAFTGVIGQTMIYFKMGLRSQEGLSLIRYNPSDHVWHVSLVNEIVHRFPPQEPGLYGIPLENYHYWFNLVTAELVRVFHLPVIRTQFAGMYLLGSLLIAAMVFVLCRAIYSSKAFANWTIFFLSFAGGLANWGSLVLGNSFSAKVESLFEDGTKLLDSPARGYSVIIALAAFYFLIINKDKWTRRNIFITALLFGSLMGFKVYTGIPLLFGLGVYAFYNLVKKRYLPLVVFMTSVAIALIQFLPANHSSGGLIFVPLEMPKNFIAQGVFGLSFVVQRWGIYYEHQNYLRMIQYGVIMSAFYFLIQLGVKIVGLYPVKKTRNLLGIDLSIMLYSVLFSSLVLGLFFYQKVGGGNIWEFFLTSSLVLSLLTALNLTVLSEKINKRLLPVFAMLIAIMVLPRWVYSMRDYVVRDQLSGFHGVTREELAAFDQVKNLSQKDDIVLILGTDKYKEFSSLISVMTDRPLYFSGAGVTQQDSPAYSDREKIVREIEKDRGGRKTYSLLKVNGIKYVLLNKDLNWSKDTSPGLEKMFSNDSVTVYKVN